MKISIGTRGSKLALWQAHYIADCLQKGGVATEIVTITTKGDRRQEVSIAEIGTRGVFTEEIEDQLSQRTIDIAVHSAKDLQSELPEDFEIIAYTQRERMHDVLVSHQPLESLNRDTTWTIGTSSARRKALLKHYYPALKTVEMRGNLQTRIAKMEAGQCDALMLAYAGVHRMEYDALIVHEFSLQQIIPAVGQGCIAVEALSDLDREKKEKVRSLVNDPATATQLRAERAYLKTLRGGCSIPVFALARQEAGHLRLEGGVVSLDGQALVMDQIQGPEVAAEQLGEQLAQQILDQGGEQILAEIRPYS